MADNATNESILFEVKINAEQGLSKPTVSLHPARTYTAADFDFTRAARRCATLQQKHPSWPQARVRRVVAWEMEIRTTTLRYLLRQAERE